MSFCVVYVFQPLFDPAPFRSSEQQNDRCNHPPRISVCTSKNREEYFYDAASKACRSMHEDPPPSCLAQYNRFKSYVACKIACQSKVRPNSEVPNILTYAGGHGFTDPFRWKAGALATFEKSVITVQGPTS